MPSASPVIQHRPSSPSRLRRARTAALATVVAFGVLGGPSVAQAQTPPPPAPTTGPPFPPTTGPPFPPAAPAPGPPSSPPPVPPPGIPPVLSSELADVALTSPAYDDAVGRRDRLDDDRRSALRVAAIADSEIVGLTRRNTNLTRRIALNGERARRQGARARALRAKVRDLAVDSYVNGRSTEGSPTFEFDLKAQRESSEQDVVVRQVNRSQLAALRMAVAAERRARTDVRLTSAVRLGVRRDLAATRDRRDDSRREVERLGREILRAIAEVEDERRLATVVGTDLTLVALDTYWRAARTMSRLDPTCGVSWWALAGIGRVESQHGTNGGATVRADGSVDTAIIGIPLTGAGGTAAIGDSDGGFIDGDPFVDRAAGPMQFIPTTWARWGTDGDGNGRVEIQNLYDATASAAAYVCASGPMIDDAGLSRAYFSYNHAAFYVAAVLAEAKGYALKLQIPG